jgi:dihydrofolate reductase
LITLIAVTDMNLGIADGNGNLLFDLPKDMKHFKSVTGGKIVVMGRKTWDSLPNKPLPKRKNYVLSRDVSFNPEGATIIDSIDKVVELGKGHDVFVIGGGEIYEQLLPYADRIMMTHVHVVDANAQVFFPDYNHKEWKIVGGNLQKHEKDSNHAHSFTFATYVRNENQE